MAGASWVADLNKKEHKNWVMVGGALNINKTGISPLVQREMEAWYQSLISRPPLQACVPCICAPRSRKCATCVTWETELKRLHKSKDKSKICWHNSDRKRWGSPNGAWEVAKIFMPTLGSRKHQVIDAESTDLGGLINLLEWCPFINPPVARTVLCKVRDDGRNQWAHAPKQELQDADVNAIFGYLDNLLKDPVFLADKPAQDASKDLQDLFHHGLVNVRDSELEALHLLRQTLVGDVTSCQDDIAELQVRVNQLRSDGRQADQNLQEAISKVREEVDMDRVQLETSINQVEQSIKDFNSLLDERDDLKGSIDNIREDMAGLRDRVNRLSTDLVTTIAKVESLQKSARATDDRVEDVAVRIAGLEVNVEEVKEEIKSAKKSGTWGQDDAGDALFTAPCKLSTFVGRESALTWLHEHLILKAAETCPEAMCTTKTICGLGGCGKTSLGIEFAWKNKAHFPGDVFWINVENDENINKSVIEILALLGIPASTIQGVDETLNAFLAFLSRKTLPWLLILDNADELHSSKCPAGITKILKGPWQRSDAVLKNGRMLVTTRRNRQETKTCLKVSSGDCLELSCLSDEQGARFLIQRTGMSIEDGLNQDALLLASELGGLPLALEQAAAYLCALPIPCSFREYLNKYQEVKLRLLKEQPATALSIEAHHRLSVHTTWKINFEFVREKSPAAASMMRIAAFLESERIPISVINPGFPLLDQKELRENASSKMDIASMLNVLSSYSLFSVDDKAEVFSVHKLVQEVVRDNLTMDERVETLLAATRVIHFALKKNGEPFLLHVRHGRGNLLAMKEEERNVLVAIILCFRKLQHNIDKVTSLRNRNYKKVLFNDDMLTLSSFARNIIAGDISFNALTAELSEFRLKVVRFMHADTDPDILLLNMVETSKDKRNSFSPEKREEAKKLILQAAQKLFELERSGFTISNETKFLVLEHRASYYAEEEKWEENYKSLLELEGLPKSDNQLVNLQMCIARAENLISPCNFQSALTRYNRALELGRKIYPPYHPELLRVVQYITTHLYNESLLKGIENNKGTLLEALKYADELMEMAKKQPPASDYYIRGITTALWVKNTVDPQTSEDILLDVLKNRWPNIYQYVITGEMATCSLVPEDGSHVHAARVLETLVEAFFKMATDPVINERKGKMYLRIGEMFLSIQKKFGSHPGLTKANWFVTKIHTILGNTEESAGHQKLIMNNERDESQQLYPSAQRGETMYLARQLKEVANNFFKSRNYSDALLRYNVAMRLSSNDAKLLSNRAATYVRLSEQQECSSEKRREFLELALQDSQKATIADPSWVKGFYWKAVCLAELGKRGPCLAAAAVARQMNPSACADISAVSRQYGSFNVQVVTSVQELLQASEIREINHVILVTEGSYELETPLKLARNTVMVGYGNVQMSCSKDVPLERDATVFVENISLSPTAETKPVDKLRDMAKHFFDGGQYDNSLSLYSEALEQHPTDVKLLTSRATTCMKLAEQQKGCSSEKRREFLELALQDSQKATIADPSWVKGFYWKAVCCSELGKRGPCLAAAAVARHIKPLACAEIPAASRRYGSLNVQVVTSVQELLQASEIRETNHVILVTEGSYKLETPLKLASNTVMVGYGNVQMSCSKGVTLEQNTTVFVENISLSPTAETKSVDQLREMAKHFFDAGQFEEALSLYSEALRKHPTDVKLLTRRASTYMKSAEQKKNSSCGDWKRLLELALKDAENSITADPTWLLGYYNKAACLAELDRRYPALAAAAVFQHLSRGRDVPCVTQRYGDVFVQAVESAEQLHCFLLRNSSHPTKNNVILLKEGKYELERTCTVPHMAILIGQGTVTVTCRSGKPLHYAGTYYIDNVTVVGNAAGN